MPGLREIIYTIGGGIQGFVAFQNIAKESMKPRIVRVCFKQAFDLCRSVYRNGTLYDAANNRFFVSLVCHLILREYRLQWIPFYVLFFSHRYTRSGGMLKNSTFICPWPRMGRQRQATRLLTWYATKRPPGASTDEIVSTI